MHENVLGSAARESGAEALGRKVMPRVLLLVGLLLGLGDCPTGGPPPTTQQGSQAAPRGPAAGSAMSLAAVGAAGTTPAAALDNSDEALLRLAETACDAAAPPSRTLPGVPCADRRAAAFFELASRYTSADFGLPAQSEAVLRRLASAAVGALADDSPRLQAWVLASLAGLAAVEPRAQSPLAGSAWPGRVLALLREKPSPLLRGRSLLALGALYRSLPPGELPTATEAELAAGLADSDRFVRRQAVLAATLTGSDALELPLLAALGQELSRPRPAPLSRAALLTTLSQVPTPLAAPLAADLAPLLPPFVDLLLSLSPPEATAVAMHLVDATMAAEPLSATAYYLAAKIRDGRRDGTALPLLRRALALGNLPTVFVASLGEPAAALTPPVDLTAARARLRQILAQRPRPPAPANTATTARALPMPRPDAVQPGALEKQAAELLSQQAADSPAGLALGRTLFRQYPFSSEEYYSDCLHSFLDAGGSNHDLLDRLGLQAARAATGDGRRWVGVVAVGEAAAASPGRLGVTCALCHTQVDSTGERGDGLPSRTYDQGLLLAGCIDQPIFHKSQNRNLDQLLEYGPGRNDSTADGVHDPTEIPNLFALAPGSAVRWNGDLPTLELQIDRNLSQRSAPPAVVALVASYLRSLGPARAAQVAPHAGQTGHAGAGAAIFERECARCHQPPLYSHGQVVPLERLGTDRRRISAVLPNSSPGYKVPSLLALGRTAPYLHDGSIATLEDLFNPRRGGGHRFGLQLGSQDRQGLLAFLRGL